MHNDADFKVAELHLALNEANSHEMADPVVYWNLSLLWGLALSAPWTYKFGV